MGSYRSILKAPFLVVVLTAATLLAALLLVCLGAASFISEWLRELLSPALPVILLLCGVGFVLAFIVTALVSRRMFDLERFLRAMRAGTFEGRGPKGLLPEFPRLAPLIVAIDRMLARAQSGGENSLDLLTSNRMLARELRRLHQLLDSTGDGLIAVDTAGKILFANRAAKPFLNIALEEAPGEAARKCLLHGEVAELISSEGTARALHGVHSVELPADEQSERGHIVVYHSHGIGDAEESVGDVLVFRDTSRLKAMESLQTEFVDSIAHELRTPLTSIRAYVEMLIDGKTADPQMQYDFYNVIYEETYRLSELIDNLLNISMMESGMAELDIAPTRLKRVLEDSVEVVRVQCEKKDIELVVDLADRLPTLDIDKRLFNMAFMNILGNAVKYTPEKGTVTLATSSHEDDFQIHVRDTGIGISEEDFPRIFDKFYRAASVKDIQGSGVGLATAAEIIRLHGGEIRVTSQAGEGSQFTVVLPRTLINTSIGE